MDSKAIKAIERKEQEWLSGVRKAAEADAACTVGIEITARMVISDGEDMAAVEECLESFREYGAAEITKKVVL